MAHYAQIDENNTVTQVIVAEQSFIDSGAVGTPSSWFQTSYNTRGGVHYGQDGNPDGKPQLRKNYAGIGYKYDSGRDAFIPKQPFASWSLNEQSCLWQAPTPKPTDSKIYFWDEPSLLWVVSE
jgi:hypothetical protein